MVHYKCLTQKRFYIIHKYYRLKNCQHSITKQCNLILDRILVIVIDKVTLNLAIRKNGDAEY